MFRLLFRPLSALAFVVLSFCLAGSATAQTTVFADEFNSGSLNNSWAVYGSDRWLSRTQFGNSPIFASEGSTSYMRLKLDTYNPDFPGTTLRGTEIHTKTQFPMQNGTEIEARVRAPGLPRGIVWAFFVLGERGVWPDTYSRDEIDFENLTSLGSEEIWTNVYNDFNPNISLEGGSEKIMTAPGLNRNNWTIYKIRYYTDRIEWWVNVGAGTDILVRTEADPALNANDPQSIRFNIWASDSNWGTAYGDLPVTDDSAQNQSYYFDVDYVRMRVIGYTPPPTPVGTGDGLKGEYFENADFTGETISRVDPQVNFDWLGGEPATGFDSNTFSVRWTGQVQAQYSETYTFYINADDGVRLWVNGRQLVNEWRDQGLTEFQNTIDLVAGQKYDIKIEYYENIGYATAQLSWSSASTPKAAVPQSQLYSESESTPPVVPVGTGDGLSGEYYDNSDFTDQKLTRVDPQINFDWPVAPDATMGADTFSVRWTGQVQAQFSETYTFHVTADDGVRLWVNDQQLMDEWGYKPVDEYTATIALVAGQKYSFRMDHFDRDYGATAKLSWSSPSTPKEIIPQSQLYSSSGSTPPPADSIAPTVSISTPINTYSYHVLAQTAGVASDTGGSNLQSVRLRLFRAEDSTYWNGSSWSATETENAASGTTNWTWALPALTDGRYLLRASAVDGAGNIGYSSVIDFFIDNQAPAVSIDAPEHNGNYTTVPQADGTAADEVGVAEVRVLLQRAGDSLYWNGSAWSATETELLASGTTDWTLALPTLSNGEYSLRATARDWIGNIGVSSEVVFSIDSANAAPTITIIEPKHDHSYSSLPSAHGTASDSDGVTEVRGILRRGNNGQYWTGSGWSDSWAEVLANGTNNWVFTMPPLAGGYYTFWGVARDSSGNETQTDGVNFYVP